MKPRKKLSPSAPRNFLVSLTIKRKAGKHRNKKRDSKIPRFMKDSDYK